MRLHVVTPGQLAHYAKQRNFFQLYSLFASKWINKIFGTLTGSKHVGQAKSYRCCIIGYTFNSNFLYLNFYEGRIILFLKCHKWEFGLMTLKWFICERKLKNAIFSGRFLVFEPIYPTKLFIEGHKILHEGSCIKQEVTFEILWESKHFWDCNE